MGLFIALGAADLLFLGGMALVYVFVVRRRAKVYALVEHLASLARTSPDRRSTEWTIALVLVVSVPETSVADAAVSMTPVTAYGRALTVAPVFVRVNGVLRVPQGPRKTGKLQPDLTVSATFTKEPYASPECWIPDVDGTGVQDGDRHGRPARRNPIT